MGIGTTALFLSLLHPGHQGKREVKIYLLVNQYSPELNLVNEVCLIRYNLKNIGSFILTNPNSNQKSGLFFGGHLTEQSLTLSNQILNELKEKEVTELYHHFCFHFWETAKKEVIEVGKHNIIYSKPKGVGSKRIPEKHLAKWLKSYFQSFRLFSFLALLCVTSTASFLRFFFF